MMRLPFMSALALIVLLSGCGGSTGLAPSTQDNEQGLLNEVGEMYRLTSLEKKKPPATVKDFEVSRAVAPQAYEAVRSGNVVVQYNATLTSLLEGPPEGTSDEVVAYEKQVPESGGQVLMLNRSVRKMTAEEFKAAKKAGK